MQGISAYETSRHVCLVIILLVSSPAFAHQRVVFRLLQSNVWRRKCCAPNGNHLYSRINFVLPSVLHCLQRKHKLYASIKQPLLIIFSLKWIMWFLYWILKVVDTEYISSTARDSFTGSQDLQIPLLSAPKHTQNTPPRNLILPAEVVTEIHTDGTLRFPVSQKNIPIPFTSPNLETHSSVTLWKLYLCGGGHISLVGKERFKTFMGSGFLYWRELFVTCIIFIYKP